MPRGSNPNSRANLIANTERTPKQIQKRNQKAGKKSGEVRAAFKSLCDTVKEQCTNEDRQEIAKVLVRMAKHGNLGAVDRLLKMFGEDSALKIELSGSVSNPSERFASFSDDELRQAIEALQKKSGEE